MAGQDLERDEAIILGMGTIQVKAIVKAIIGQKNWPSQWSRQLFFLQKNS